MQITPKNSPALAALVVAVDAYRAARAERARVRDVVDAEILAVGGAEPAGGIELAAWFDRLDESIEEISARHGTDAVRAAERAAHDVVVDCSKALAVECAALGGSPLSPTIATMYDHASRNDSRAVTVRDRIVSFACSVVDSL